MTNMQIPKVIHYCWFGRGKKPKLVEKCIASWRQFMPDYEIKEWNEDNFDVNLLPYMTEAYAAKKWAFVSDYARFWIIYNYGGVYFDTDVELIGSPAGIISQGPFIPFSIEGHIEVGSALVASPGLPILREVLDDFAMAHFRNPDGTLSLEKTVNFWMMNALRRHGCSDNCEGLVCLGFRILNSDCFMCPDARSRVHVTKNTIAIHHYAGSWGTPRQRIACFVRKKCGQRASQAVSLLMHNPFYIVKRIHAYLKS